MKTKTVKRVFFILILGFALTFLLRFVYELTDYMEYSDSSYNNNYYPSYASYEGKGSEYIKTQNLATARQTISEPGGTGLSYEQKYEMISNITAYSDNFDSDESALRKTVDDFNGVVQMEYSSGLDGARSLWISVGITPGKFDELVESVKAIGNITSFSVNKTDKTAEFRSLTAQREALEKTRDAYVSLKSQGGAMIDLLAVEERIIETEKEILQAGVELGIYDENLSMCTVDFTLSEHKQKERSGITLYIVLSSAEDALPWSVLFYLVALIFAVGTAFSALGIAFVWGRITAPAKQAVKQQANDSPAANDRHAE